MVFTIAHRGASGDYLENSKDSLLHAVRLGTDMIEIDINICKTYEIVLIHDTIINTSKLKNNKKTESVSNLTYNELKRLIPTLLTLKECMTIITNECKILIELKETDVDIQVYIYKIIEILKGAILYRKWNAENIYIQSFNHKYICRFNELCDINEIKYGYLIENVSYNFPCFLNFVTLDKDIICDYYINHIVEKSLLIFIYTVNNLKEIEKILQFDINGIIGDYPDIIMSIIKYRLMKIVSWNIAGLPWYVNLNGDPTKRIKKIIKKIKSLKADFICLQEVFDRKIIQTLKDNFENKHNYNIVFSPDSSRFYKINGGLCIITKTKILHSSSYIFKHSCGEDSFSEKGLLYIIVKINNKKIAIVNTHLNASNPIFIFRGDIEVTQKHQLNEVIQFIKKINKKYNINNFVFCGDLNIEINSKNYKRFYKNMKKEYKNIIVNNKLFTFNKKQYDYIFNINNNKKTEKICFKIRRHCSLSDHNIVQMTISKKSFK